MSGNRRLQITADAALGLERVLAVADAHPGASLGDAYLGRTTTDVLAHLHAWHELFAGWMAAHDAGDSVAYPAAGFTWRELDALNEAIYEAHAGRDFATVRASLVASHERMLGLIATLSDANLETPEAFPWAGGEAIGAVAHECLGAHYAWATETFEAAGLAAQ